MNADMEWVTDHEAEVSSADLGIDIHLKMDGFAFNELEAAEVAEMLMRVIQAWVRRRELTHLNLDKFGISVH